MAHALARSADFDLIHNHLDWLPLRSHDRASTDGHDDSWFSARGYAAPVHERPQSAFVSISIPIALPSSTTWRRFITGSISTCFRCLPSPAIARRVRQNSSRQGHGPGDRDRSPRRPQLVTLWDRAGRTLFPREVNPTSTAIAFAISVRSGPRSAPRSSAVQRCCFTPSRSTNPSDYRWSKRWHAVRRSSRTLAVRCARSWTKAGPVGWSTARLPQRNGSTQPRHSIAQPFAPSPNVALAWTEWSTNTSRSTGASSAAQVD